MAERGAMSSPRLTAPKWQSWGLILQSLCSPHCAELHAELSGGGFHTHHGEWSIAAAWVLDHLADREGKQQEASVDIFLLEYFKARYRNLASSN